MKKLVIKLDSPNGFYTGGQTVTGVVELDLVKPMRILRMFLSIIGKASVVWLETQRSGTSGENETRGSGEYETHGSGEDEPTIYSTHECYLESECVPLIPETAGGGEIMVAVGLHRFPFSVVLPRKLPSSFTGTYGSVQYVVDVTIARKSKPDTHVRLEFTVVSVLDLNNESDSMKVPCAIERDQDVSCCCLTGRILGKITLNKRCFVPGEAILISADIHNQSKWAIKMLIAELEQHTEFHIPTHNGGPRSTSSVVILRTARTDKSIPAGGNGGWSNVPLVVPGSKIAVPSKLDGCSIINVNYVLKFRTNNGFALQFDVLIGNVPMRDPEPAVTSQPMPSTVLPTVDFQTSPPA